VSENESRSVLLSTMKREEKTFEGYFFFCSWMVFPLFSFRKKMEKERLTPTFCRDGELEELKLI
jgi:hypothetical protein